MKFTPFALAAILALAACHSPESSQNKQSPATKPSPNAQYKALLFADVQPEHDATPAPPALPATLWQEVVLDRLGFSSGVIDGKATQLDKLALRGFQAANGLSETGELDEATSAALEKWRSVQPTRLVRIPAAFADGPFYPDLPKKAAGQARYDHLGYRDIMEALAERFHTTPALLAALNDPAAKVGAGAIIRVPNIPDVDIAALGPDQRGWNRTLVTLGVSPRQPVAATVVVDESDGALRAYDGAGKLLVQFPATMGSEHDPLPIGDWKILGLSRNPDFHYNPDLFWDAGPSDEEHMLKPGPNGPVGVVWLALSKEHYGIHGTGEPGSIGLTESHGCVRLTNWDAARLAQMVKPGLVATFQE